MSGSRRWAAFALVTVLLTVVTLLVLWYPVLADGLKDAQQASCIANLKKIILATRMYCSDWDGAYPNSALTGASYSEAYGGELPKNMQFERQRKGWPVALAPYLADSQVLWCPADGDLAEHCPRCRGVLLVSPRPGHRPSLPLGSAALGVRHGLRR